MGWRDLDPSQLQWDGRTAGHHEAFALMLNVPREERGFWFRFTVDAPRTDDPHAAVWAASFDARDPDHTFALRHQVGIKELTTMSGGLDLRIGHQQLKNRSSRGGLRTDDPERELRWNLQWEPVGGALYQFPRSRMYERAWPPTKLCSPIRNLVASGVVIVNGRQLDLRNARGAITHTWGPQYASSWAWGHCSSFREDPSASIEAFTFIPEKDGRAHTVVHFEDEDRQIGLNSMWSMKRAWAEVSDRGLWRFRAQRRSWRLEGRLSSPLDRMVGVLYEGPQGEVRACHHSDVADAVFHLYKRGFTGWNLEQTYTARTGASFEILRPAPIEGVELYVE